MSSRPYQIKEFKYNSHYWLLRLIAERKQRMRILDVGTADGYLGARLAELGHRLVGIENDPAAAQGAAPYYEIVHRCDVETFDFPYRREFDAILLADVLEHLRRPEEVLRRCLPCLADGGEVIVSVPNVANLWIRLSLLLGRFEYAERGILDKTHLRFFTLATLRRMVEECGYRILDTIATPLPVQLVLPVTLSSAFAPFHELHYLLVRGRKTLLAYQFVLRLAAPPR